MYYWDTYFTNIGLMLSGRHMQAKFNVDNMLYLVDKYGFMPNGNRTFYLGKSQPPFLSVMVKDIYDYYKDKVWLRQAYETLKTEYKFWMTKRRFDMGLNYYDGLSWTTPAEVHASNYEKRVGYAPEGTVEEITRHFMATCESGWDVSHRWNHDCYNYASVDLNSLMYMFEENMCCFCKEIGNGFETEWQTRAEKRRELMHKYLDNGNGLLTDYNVVNGNHSPILSAASFYPMYASVADKKHAEALVENLHMLETPYGILTCSENDAKGSYQWDYPNGWACLQYIAIKALDNYGYKTEAKRIAGNYIDLVEKVFAETGNLWEKYNVIEGNINVTNEYDMPPMMGWTAGVYLGAKNYIKQFN